MGYQRWTHDALGGHLHIFTCSADAGQQLLRIVIVVVMLYLHHWGFQCH